MKSFFRRLLALLLCVGMLLCFSAVAFGEDEEIKEAVDFIVGEELMKIGHREHLERLYHELLNKDWFMTLLDYKDYAAKKEEIYRDYENRMAWAKKMLVNTAKAGYFSSDRTIEEYNNDIWKL